MAATAPRFSRRFLLQAAGLAGLGVAGAPLLTSCGSGSDPTSGPEGRLLLGTTQIMQFDPYLTNTGIHIHTLYTYLIDYAGPDDYTPVPAGATRWEFAPDQGSVTIELRKASFHSGAPVTADDVVAGVERALDPEAGLTLAQPSAFVDKATAVGERKVRVDFVRPTPKEIVLDWMFAFPLVPAGRNEPAKLETEPAGSGPFRLESYAKDRNLVLTKNADYWEKARPLLDRVEFRFFNDEDALVAALEAGDVDGAAYLALRHTERLRERYRLVNGAGRMDLFFMNGAIPPFDDKRLRQAVARAINRKRIIEQVSFGAGEPIYTAFMPSSPAFESSYLDSHGYDLAAARTLLESSRAARKATAVVGTEPGAMEMLQIIQADLKEIGFELTIDPREQTAFLDALFGGQVQCCVAAQPNNMQSPALVSRGRQMLPTPDNVMMGDAVPQAYVDAVDAAWTALTPDDQQAAYRRLNEVLVEEAWAVGICTRPSLFALDTGVQGLTTDPRDFLNLTSTKVA